MTNTTKLSPMARLAAIERGHRELAGNLMAAELEILADAIEASRPARAAHARALAADWRCGALKDEFTHTDKDAPNADQI